MSSSGKVHEESRPRVFQTRRGVAWRHTCVTGPLQDRMRIHAYTCVQYLHIQLHRPGPAHRARGGGLGRRRRARGCSFGYTCATWPSRHQSLGLTALALVGLNAGPCLGAPRAPWRQHGGPDWRLGPFLLILLVPAHHLGQEQRAAAHLDLGLRGGFRRSPGSWGHRGLVCGVWARRRPPL